MARTRGSQGVDKHQFCDETNCKVIQQNMLSPWSRPCFLLLLVVCLFGGVQKLKPSMSLGLLATLQDSLSFQTGYRNPPRIRCSCLQGRPFQSSQPSSSGLSWD